MQWFFVAGKYLSYEFAKRVRGKSITLEPNDLWALFANILTVNGELKTKQVRKPCGNCITETQTPRFFRYQIL